MPDFAGEVEVVPRRASTSTRPSILWGEATFKKCVLHRRGRPEARPLWFRRQRCENLSFAKSRRLLKRPDTNRPHRLCEPLPSPAFYGFERINAGPIFFVANDAAVPRINACGKRRSVHLGGTWIDRMMMGECDAFLRQAERSRRILGRNGIGAQSVPHHHHDVFGFARLGFARHLGLGLSRDGKQKRQQQRLPRAK